MPKRPLPPDPPETPAVLEAIKLVHQNGKQLTEQEIKEFGAYRSQSSIRKLPDTTIQTRREQTVYRTVGAAGADMLEHPESLANREKLRKHFVDISAVLRQPPESKIGVLAKKAKARKLVLKIYALADENVHRGPGRAVFIAKRLKISAKYVREVLRKRTEREGADSQVP